MTHAYQVIATPLSRRVDASFRDPEGYVFVRDHRVYRAVAPDLANRLRRAQEQGVLPRLFEEGRIVRTWFVTDERLRFQLESENPGWHHFLEHDPLPLITYPYEWCLSMLTDAAILTLDLQMALAEAGFSLKDATPFNVQFVGSRPLFIDLGSIDVPTRFDVWYALGQFQRMFLYPLILMRYRGWDLRSYFLSDPNGRDPAFVVRALGPIGRWRPGVLLDVTLPWLLTAHSGKWQHSPASPEQSGISLNREPMLWNLRRMRRKIIRLSSHYRPHGIWAHYSDICNYDDRAENAKQQFVETVLRQERPDWVVDLGCNTGDYSLLAAKLGSRVIAVDQDHDAIETLYQRIRNKDVSVWPIVLDITNPSPGIGLNNKERQPFLERIQADYVFALALVHHLLVSCNLSLEQIEKLLYNLATAGVIIEFVPPTDEMFRSLTRFRRDSFEHVNLSAFRRIFSTRFTVVRELPVPNSQRTLFWLRKKAH